MILVLLNYSHIDKVRRKSHSPLHNLELKPATHIESGPEAHPFAQFPYGLAVRIPGFHPGDPGSTPGMGRHAPLCFSPLYRQRSQDPCG